MARRGRLAKAGALGVLGLVGLTGCATPNNLFWRWGWPNGITDQAHEMRNLWIWSCIVALIIGFMVWGLIIWAMIRYRKRGNRLPRQTAYNLPLEIVYTIFPFVIIAGLFFFTVGVQNDVMKRSDNPDVAIGVNAFKWNWQFVYPDSKGSDGKPVSTIGTSDEVPILVIPVDRTVRFEEASADVIHSFWVPEFLFKLDVIPGNDNGRNNVFQITAREKGAYVGRCAELCGTYHAFMNFEVRTVSPQDYDAYIRAREQGQSTAAALRSIGQPGTAVTTKPYNLRTELQQQQAQGNG